MATITKEQFYRLEGLLILAKHHNRALRDIERLAAQITGEPDEGNYFGLTTDAIFGGEDATTLLRDLEIEVV